MVCNWRLAFLMKEDKNTNTYHSLPKRIGDFSNHFLDYTGYFIICFLAISIFLGFRPVCIVGCSMSPTFETGTLCIAKDIHNEDPLPERGSIVIFSSDEDNSILYAKRLIGLPGDSLMAENDVLTVNGAYYDYIQGTSDWIADVPDGYVFCLGDNRSNSFDSRRFGCVPVEQITAKILFYLPFS